MTDIPNVLFEPAHVSNIHQEFLSLINYYQNLKRPSVYLRYYNISREESAHNHDNDVSFDTYHYTNVKYKLFDLTPAFYIAPVTNTAANVTDLKGYLMDATTSIVVYTIREPRFNDIVSFYRPVQAAGEFFRVMGIRAAINAVKGSEPVTWWELELEYAPINSDTCSGWQLLEHLVYDMSSEEYISQEEYSDKLEDIQELEELLKELCQYYDSQNDVYQADSLAPQVTNDLISIIKREGSGKYERGIWQKFMTPFGYLDLLNCPARTIDDVNFPVDPIDDKLFQVYNLDSGQWEEYYWFPEMDGANDDGINALLNLSYQIYQFLQD